MMRGTGMMRGAGMMRRQTVALGTVFSLMASCVYSNSGETPFKVQGDTLIMNGEIYTSTLGDFEDVMDRNPQITTLREGIVTGSNDDDTMIALSYLVRDMGLDTELLSDSEIYSGGTDLFLAGVNRRMEVGAIIGVHSWSDGTNDAMDFPRSSSEHDMNRRYIEDMLGDDAFYWFTIEAAPANGMHNMTPNEIATFGLLTQPALPAGTLQ